jgi:hypothetical protein
MLKEPSALRAKIVAGNLCFHCDRGLVVAPRLAGVGSGAEFLKAVKHLFKTFLDDLLIV